ncbi:hypothetical protein SSP531S_34760 [Streptomyces spongiicola]|uniref:Uncharacterized protein n=1 Tax=Streptomyces spongiicola TaxID=1690221 RepID=A0A388T171_9ACTN|nr:hypothetical protein SSP531S_34760 [Streptomyces spongiicola]
MFSGEFEETREEAVADLTRAVPGEDHELRRRLAWFERRRGPRLPGLLSRIGRRAVAYGAHRPLRRTGPLAAAPARVIPAPSRLTAAPSRFTAARTGAAARGTDGRGGTESRSEQAPSSDVAHAGRPRFPVAFPHVLAWREMACGTRGFPGSARNVRDGHTAMRQTPWTFP